ncbi:hypothetical protein C3L33_02797, partial [Rhododendron williamsianum]
MRGRSYSYSPSPPRGGYSRRRRSPSPRGRYGGRDRDLPTSLLVRNLPMIVAAGGLTEGAPSLVILDHRAMEDPIRGIERRLTQGLHMAQGIEKGLTQGLLIAKEQEQKPN